MSVDIPFLSYERMRTIAEEFLAKHHQSRFMPVPIERIIDNDFQIDIVPTPGLHSGFDIDSYITSDFEAIHVDSFVYEERPARFRFSLAHELAHYLIHRSVFRQLSFSSIREWKTVAKSIPEKEYGILEWQANCLAGLILVPSDELSAEYDRCVDRVEIAGLSFRDNREVSLDFIEKHIAAHFEVSSIVTHKRIEFDKLAT